MRTFAIMLLLFALLSASADEQVTHNETGVIVDHVSFGEDHWTQASGDKHEDDGEIDDSFGEHRGAINFRHWGTERSLAFAMSKGNEVQWDFVTPHAGDFVIAVNGGGKNRGGDLHVRDGEGWTHLMRVSEGAGIFYYLLETRPAGRHRFMMRGYGSPYYLHASSLYTRRRSAMAPGSHPRLLFRPADLPALRAKMTATPLLKEYYGRLLRGWASAGSYLNVDLSRGGWAKFGTWALGDRPRADIMTTLGLAYVLTGERKYGRKCVDILLKVAQWDDAAGGWGRMHFSQLANGGMLTGVSLAYDWAYDVMTDGERRTVQDALVREAQYVYSLSMDQRWWWTDPNSLNNWCGVIHGGLGLASLVVDGVDEMADQWRRRSIEMTNSLLDVGFAEDGTYFESFGYYGYAFQNVVPFLYALRDLRDTDLFTYRDSILKKSLKWGMYLIEPSRCGRTPFDDQRAPSTLTNNVVLGLARYFRDGHAVQAWDLLSGSQRLPTVFPYKSGSAYLQLPLTLIYYDPTLELRSLEELPLSKVWPKSGRACFRTGFEDLNDLYFYMQCGLDGSHAHNDHGSFVLSAYGDRLVVDEGYGGWYASMQAHNLILIDGENPKVKTDHSKHLGHIDRFVTSEVADYLRASNAEMYAHVGEPVSHSVRHVLFVKPSFFVVLDEIRKDDAAHEYHWLLHTDREDTREKKENSHEIASVATDRFRFAKRLKSEDEANLEILAIEPSSGLSWSAEEHVDRGVHYPWLKLSSPKTVAARFLAVLYPTDDTHQLPEHRIVRKDACSIVELGESVVVGSGKSGARYEHGDITTDALLFMSRTTKGGHELFVAGATVFIRRDKALLEAPASVDFALRPSDNGLTATLSCDEAVNIRVGGLQPNAAYTVTAGQSPPLARSADASGQIVLDATPGANQSLRIVRTK